MKNLFFYFKIKCIKKLIPYLVNFNAFNLLSLLFILSLSKVKPILPKNKIKFKIIILSKSGGIDDIIESQKKYNNSSLYLACPRIFLVTIFNTIFDDNEYHDTKKFYSKAGNLKRENYRNFLNKFLKVLKEKYDFHSFIGFNFEFKEEIDFASSCNKLKIPFFLLYKESVLTEKEAKYLRYVLIKLNEKFSGYKIAVYSEYAKKIFTESNFIDRNKIEVIGCPRLSKSFSFKKIIPKNQILYYAIENKRGLPDPFIKYYGNSFFKDFKEHKKYNQKYNWSSLHIKTLNILKKFAKKNPGISIIIKIKTGQLAINKQYLDLPSNIKLQYFGAGHQLLEKSKVVIAWNTTAILEGIAANRFILLPYFHSKKNNLKKENELMLKLKDENYGYSENDFYKKLDFFMKNKYDKNKTYNNHYSLKYHLGNSDNKADLRLSRFLNKNIKY